MRWARATEIECKRAFLSPGPKCRVYSGSTSRNICSALPASTSATAVSERTVKPRLKDPKPTHMRTERGEKEEKERKKNEKRGSEKQKERSIGRN